MHFNANRLTYLFPNSQHEKTRVLVSSLLFHHYHSALLIITFSKLPENLVYLHQYAQLTDVEQCYRLMDIKW
ncbi:hypothetical protein ACA910_021841 [Epithemia clementina (nom. ined.)]